MTLPLDARLARDCAGKYYIGAVSSRQLNNLAHHIWTRSHRCLDCAYD